MHARDISRKLRYHGRWILTKNGKKLFFAVQIEKTEINILQKKLEKKLFYFSSFVVGKLSFSFSLCPDENVRKFLVRFRL